MNDRPSRWKAYAELGRISNLPTCFANVMVGCSIDDIDSSPEWIEIFLASIAAGSIYIGGMAMNDLVDERHDRRHRPERPLPSGRIARSSALIFMTVAFSIGFAVSAWLGATTFALGVLLIGLVGAYNALHKRFAWSFPLMGACRAVVYALAASTLFDSLPWWFLIGFGSSIFLYTSTITLIARSENEERLGRRRLLAFAMPVFLLYPTLLPSYLNVGLILAAGVLGLAWMSRAIRFVRENPPKIQPAVLTWLSGMCLLDAYFLALLDQPILFAAAVGCFVLTHWGHRRISGT